MRGLLIASLLLTLLLSSTFTANAQEASPASAGCTVEPRTDAELDALAATPYVPSPEASPEGTSTALPAGEPVDEETLAALTDTLNQVTACAEAGDINRLLALYSDEYIVQHIFAREPQPIIPGRAPEDGISPAATPGAPLATSEVHEANLLPDGRIAATVATGDALDIVSFVQGEDGRWVIDGIQSVASGSNGATPEGEPGTYPQPVQVALELAATRLGVSVDELTIESVEPKDWPDTSLGCPKEGEFYAQVITPGYLVLVSAKGTTLEYHTNETDNVVFCGEK